MSRLSIMSVLVFAGVHIFVNIVLNMNKLSDIVLVCIYMYVTLAPIIPSFVYDIIPRLISIV